jgi:hypothetical protein
LTVIETLLCSFGAVLTPLLLVTVLRLVAAERGGSIDDSSPHWRVAQKPWQQCAPPPSGWVQQPLRQHLPRQLQTHEQVAWDQPCLGGHCCTRSHSQRQVFGLKCLGVPLLAGRHRAS